METIILKKESWLTKTNFDNINDFLLYLQKMWKLDDFEDFLIWKKIEENEKVDSFVEEKEIFNILDELIWK